ncbi:MAG TPA: Ig-like domain-containing protein [Pseudolabrys sp.]|nr:Ig-like domain-containing protein [Pseudolabrys sp.]
MSAVLKITGISPDTGTSSTDGITDTSHINVLGSGAVANSVVTVFDGVTALGTTTANGSGVWTFNYTASTLGDGAHNLTANDGVNTSGIFTATIDTSTPAPTLDTITTDSGKSATDFITSDHTLVLNGTAEAGAEVDAFINGVSKAFATADASGNYSIDLGSQAVSLADGTYSVQILATDVAGNSHFSGVSSVTVDSTAAAAPVISNIVTDSGRSSSDGVTNQMNFDLHGTAVAGDEVDVYADGGFVASVTADGSGNWTYSASQGGNTTADWTAKDVDTAGNVSSASSAFHVVVDVSAPAAPGTPDLADASDTGRSQTDDITKDSTPTVTGTSEGNAIIHVRNGTLLD